LETILIDRGESTLIETIATGFDDVDILGDAIGGNGEANKDDGGTMLMKGFERKSFGLNTKDELWRQNVSTYLQRCGRIC